MHEFHIADQRSIDVAILCFIQADCKIFQNKFLFYIKSFILQLIMLSDQDALWNFLATSLPTTV